VDVDVEFEQVLCKCDLSRLSHNSSVSRIIIRGNGVQKDIKNLQQDEKTDDPSVLTSAKSQDPNLPDSTVWNEEISSRL